MGNEGTECIQAARDAIEIAERRARQAWEYYIDIEVESGYDKRAARAQGATHLPEDIRDILGIDRYGS